MNQSILLIGFNDLCSLLFICGIITEQAVQCIRSLTHSLYSLLVLLLR